LRDIRKQQKAERNYYQRQGELQACVVCGRLFCRRKDVVCSMACKGKLDADQEGQSLK
jgi:hypothetical protein